MEKHPTQPWWERLPPDTKETCDTGIIVHPEKHRGKKTFGLGKGDSGTEIKRCGKPASWRNESTCNCGAVHNIWFQCEEHRAMEAEESAKFATEYEKLDLGNGMIAYRKKE